MRGVLRLRLGLALVLGALLALAPAAHSKQRPGGDLLPDLQALKATDLQLEVLPGGVRHLRFGTEIANYGVGPLELQPIKDDCDKNGNFDDDRTALQRVFIDDDWNGYFTRGDDLSWDYEWAGCFYYHEEHHHWHFENFANYRLRSYVDGRIGPVVRSSDKISFCMLDSIHPKPGLRGSPRNRYYAEWPEGCGSDDISGISIGWADRYPPEREGQHIDITGLPDANYCLLIVADPADRIREKKNGNNTSKIKITLRGDTVDWFPYRRC
jgi:hypothetical protein